MKIRMKDGTGTVDRKFVFEDFDRHGNARVYARRKRRKIRLRQPYGTREFLEEIDQALKTIERGPEATKKLITRAAARGTFRWLCVQYFKSSKFARMTTRTQTVRRGILDGMCREHGTKPFARMESRHVRKIREARADKPEAANSRIKALRQLFAWAIDAEEATSNPARDVPYLESRNPDGWHTATVDEVRQFEARHPIGTKARLALSLFMFTGVRRSDAVRLGRQLERPGDADSPHGWLCFTETKGRNRNPKQREIPIIRELREVLDATPSGHLTYLVTQFGKPFTANGFGNWFRKRCDEAGLPLVSAHTLRKAAATIAAENGATEYQLMAIFDWMTPKEAARYVRKVNRKKLIIDAMRLVVPKQKENPSVPLSKAVTTGGTIEGKKP